MTATGSTEARPAAEYTVTKIDPDGPDDAGWLRLTVELPAIGSVKEVDLDVSSRHIEVTSAPYAPLKVDLDKEVDPEGAKAKFVKKTRQLRVDLPIKVKRRSSAAQMLKAQAQAEAGAARAQRSERLTEEQAAKDAERAAKAEVEASRLEAAAAAKAAAAKEQEEAAQVKMYEAEQQGKQQKREAETEAGARKAEGNAAFKAKDYSLAETKYADALRACGRFAADPELKEMSVVLNSNRAEALLQLSRFDEAQKAARAALAVDPSHAKSKQRLQRAIDAVAAEKKKAAAKKKKAAQAARKKKNSNSAPDDGIEEFFTEGYLELEKRGGGRR